MSIPREGRAASRPAPPDNTDTTPSSPRELIQHLTRLGGAAVVDEEAATRGRRGEDAVQHKRAKRGGGGEMAEEGGQEETPRTMLTRLARDKLPQTSGSRSSMVSIEETPTSGKALIKQAIGALRGLGDVQSSASRSVAGSTGESWNPDYDQNVPQMKMGPPPLPTTVARIPIPQLVTAAGYNKRRGRPPKTTTTTTAEGIRPARASRSDVKEVGEIPSGFLEDFFKTELSRYPKPNVPTTGSLEIVRASAKAFFAQMVSDYRKQATIDEKSRDVIVKQRVLLYMVDAGLLENETLGDAARRLLEREDADLALDLVQSVTKRTDPVLSLSQARSRRS